MFTKRRAETEYHRYLKEVPMFATLSTSELDAIAGAVTDLRLEPGRVVVEEGRRAAEMMIVTGGIAEVTCDGAHVATLQAGDVVGELAVLARQRRTASVVAITEVELIHLTADRFAQLLADVPAIAPKLLGVVASRVTDQIQTGVTP